MELTSNIAERLSKILQDRSISVTELAANIGLSKQAVSAYCTGARSPKRPTIDIIAQRLNVNPLWLIGYDVPAVALKVQKTQNPPAGFEPLPETDKVPRVGRIACGEPILAEENIEDYDSIPSSWHATFTLLCVGDSMAPRIQDGDLVAIRKQPEVENGEIAAVRIDDEATLKRVYLYPDRMVLQPENQAYAPIVLVGDEINTVAIEGKAVGLCRAIM